MRFKVCARFEPHFQKRRLQRERYKEFVACQVKTLSFLTYLLRGFSDLMKPYEDASARGAVSLRGLFEQGHILVPFFVFWKVLTLCDKATFLLFWKMEGEPPLTLRLFL